MEHTSHHDAVECALSSVDEGFYFLCRLCALKFSEPHGMAIFSEDGCARDVAKKIQDCLQFCVAPGDKFPQTLCQYCLYKLEMSHEFLMKTLDAQQYLSELVQSEEVLDTIYEIKNELRNPRFELNELRDTATIQVLDELVGDHPQHHNHHHHLQHTMDNSNIGDIMQYHSADMNDVQMHSMGIASSLPKTNHEDDDSLPDITLYPFDAIVDTVKSHDFLDGTEFQSDDAAQFEADVEALTEAIDEVNQAVETDAIQNPLADSEILPKKVKKATKVKSLKICEICQKTFTTNYRMRMHMKAHSTDLAFKCSHPGCPKQFRSKIGLVQHEAQHTGDHRFACPVCGKGFQVRSYLTTHLKSHSDVKPYKCGECGEAFRAKQTMLDHEARHLGVKAFGCGHCEQRFISKALCVRHEKTQHGIGNSVNKPTESNGPVVRRYPCHICHRLFNRQNYLKTHMIVHTGEKPFECDICEKRISTSYDLKMHRRSHTSETAYVCETCGKSFKRSDSLNIHRRSHTGERPYKCDYCEQGFMQISALKLHVRVHTGERPFACTMCEKRFLTRSSLVSHKKKHGHSDDEMLMVHQHHQLQPEGNAMAQTSASSSSVLGENEMLAEIGTTFQEIENLVHDQQ